MAKDGLIVMDINISNCIRIIFHCETCYTQAKNRHKTGDWTVIYDWLSLNKAMAHITETGHDLELLVEDYER